MSIKFGNLLNTSGNLPLFQSARLQLTAWYVLIVMTTSLLFSLAIYHLLSDELNASYERFIKRYEQIAPLPPGVFYRYPPGRELLTASKDRIRLNLFYINLGVLVVSASSGYFLAGRALQPIRQMLDEQNRFIADASHELRTPLTALTTSIEVGLRDKSMKLVRARQLLASNLEEVNRLRELSDGLLVLSKGAPAGQGSDDQSFSLASSGSAALETIRPLAERKRIKIDSHFEKVKLRGREDELARLLVILLDNAIKYSPSGSVVKVEGFATDGAIKVRVEDRGMGIEQKEIPKIFDRFYRVDRSRSQTAGSGLGLAIASQVVNNWGGQISVKSRLGYGSSFEISLPA